MRNNPLPKSLATVVSGLLVVTVAAGSHGEDRTASGEIPAEVRRKFDLDAFYHKYANAGGLPVVGSNKVHDAALQEAAYLINQMLVGREDIRQALIASGTRCVIMSVDEFTTDIPEHSDLTPRNFWDRRARGLGTTPQRPAVSCGEENLLALRGDPYHEENILVHEFAHAIHHMGLNRIDPTFDSKLKSAFELARKERLWEGKYAATNRAEYWAEGVQSYFETNRPPDHDHNHVDTRPELKTYDPRLFTLIAATFPKNRWAYVHPSKRKQKAHLRGVDVAKLPAFAWPERLAEESAKSEARKREKLQEQQSRRKPTAPDKP